MSRLLLATWDGAGNFPPERALVRALTARGHEVHVLAHDVLRPQVEADGARFEAYTTARQIDSSRAGVDDVFIPEVLASPAVAADYAAAIDRLKPDVLLTDCTMLTAMQTAKASGLPTVSLVHTAYSLVEGGPFAILKAPIDAADLVLVFSHKAFDPEAHPPAHTAYVGPLRPVVSAEPWQRQFPDRPLVVASLSTSEQGQQSLLQRLCDALGDLPVEAIVTTGRGVDPAGLRADANVTVTRHVAHEAVLSQADLLICHAGHGTVMVGAAHGAPMLCLPMGRDQPVVAARVAQLGIGHAGDADSNADSLKAAIAAALADTAIRARAKAFAASIAGLSNPDQAVERVESLLVACPV